MDDLSKFLDFLYEQKEGYVYVATKGDIVPETGNPEWNQEFFTWPEHKQEIHDYITLQGRTKDVYLAPALFKRKSGLKSAVKGSNVVWVEFDGQEYIDFQDLPRPDCIVQTSSDTHVHCYWKVDYLEDTKLIDGINRRLMYYLDADSSGWDASQILRPPLSKNWKYDPSSGHEVKLTHFEPTGKLELKTFDVAPEVPKETVSINTEQLLDPKKLLQDLPIGAKLKRKIVSENVSNEHDRSGFLMKIGYELAEEGCNHLQIVSLLYVVDERVGKFKGRQDRLRRLSEIASLAVLNSKQDEELILYSPFEIINHKENLEWLIPGWIHTSGFAILTGSPGVGKTTLALQLLHSFTSSGNFLDVVLKKIERVLFISLEMSIVELKYPFEHQYKEWGDDVKWDRSVRVLDQEANLIDYEEVIANFEPQLVLIDSITELSETEMGEAETRAVTRWIRKMRRRYKCAFLCIHHNRKEGQGQNKRPAKLSDLYGSYVFAKDVESVLNLERDAEEDTIELYSLKLRYGPKYSIQLEQNENLIFKEKTVDDSQPVGPIGNPGTGISFNFSTGGN